jgi:hypothetical protein
MTRLYISLIICFLFSTAHSQAWLDYTLTPNGDTINRVDKQKKKQGPWVIRLEEVRGEPGYEEEGYFVDDKKEGAWKRFSLMGDLIARELYKWGYRDGKQEYFTTMGDLMREESWKSVNPINPYDTIMVPDIDHPDVMIEKIIKHESAEIKHGTWNFYNTSTGTIARTEKYFFGKLDKGQSDVKPASPIPQKKEVAPPQKVLPKEVQAWEKNKKTKGKG